MKINTYFFMIVCISIGVNIWASSSKKETERTKVPPLTADTIVSLSEYFAQDYRPTAERCRPGIRRIGNSYNREPLPDEEVLDLTMEGGIACLLAGFKNIYLGEIFEYKALNKDNGADVKKFLRIKNIKVITMRIRDNDNFFNEIILYTPAGRVNALLLKAMYEAGDDVYLNDYLKGHLIGYTDDDIKAFYERLTDRQNDPDTFDADKVAAQKWIAAQLALMQASSSAKECKKE